MEVRAIPVSAVKLETVLEKIDRERFLPHKITGPHNCWFRKCNTCHMNAALRYQDEPIDDVSNFAGNREQVGLWAALRRERLFSD